MVDAAPIPHGEETAAPARVLLASQSPRRRRLLAWLGSRSRSPRSTPPRSSTRPLAADPAALAAHLAAEKARAARAERLGSEALVMTFDTIVVHDGAVLGKPRDLPDAWRMLRSLSGRTHAVVTGVALLCPEDDEPRAFAVATEVAMKPLTDCQIEAWMALGEFMGCAGAYNIEGQVAEVSDAECYQNVAGLPLCHLYAALAGDEAACAALGVRPARRSRPATPRSGGAARSARRHRVRRALAPPRDHDHALVGVGERVAVVRRRTPRCVRTRRRGSSRSSTATGAPCAPSAGSRASRPLRGRARASRSRSRGTRRRAGSRSRAGTPSCPRRSRRPRRDRARALLEQASVIEQVQHEHPARTQDAREVGERFGETLAPRDVRQRVAGARERIGATDAERGAARRTRPRHGERPAARVDLGREALRVRSRLREHRVVRVDRHDLQAPRREQDRVARAAGADVDDARDALALEEPRKSGPSFASRLSQFTNSS